METPGLLRNCRQISVACRHLIANSPVLKGTMRECSYNGTCIELDQRIQDGSIVMIKATVRHAKDNPPVLPEGFRSFALAEVKWSKPLPDDGHPSYAIGLRYLPH